jgi:hypothetical protein
MSAISEPEEHKAASGTVDEALLEKRRARAQLAADISARHTNEQELREAHAELAQVRAAYRVPSVSAEVAEVRAEIARLKGLDTRVGPAEQAHGTRGDRAARIADLLDRGHERLGLGEGQRTSILDFMNNPVQGGGGGMHGPLSLLLPNTNPLTSNPAMLAVELVRGAMLTRSQSKRLASYEEFAQQTRRAIRAARQEDPAMAVLLADHMQEVTTLTMQHSWKVAEEYHHHVMLRVEDGDWDLADGPDLYTLTKVLHVRHRMSGGSGEGGKGKGKGKSTAKFDKGSAKFCDVHGYCAHVTRDCEGKSKDGARAKNFRAEP